MLGEVCGGELVCPRVWGMDSVCAGLYTGKLRRGDCVEHHRQREFAGTRRPVTWSAGCIINSLYISVQE